jgi:flagellar hook assembly protein FlgD
VQVEAFNSAGEKVKFIGEIPIGADINSILISFNGVQGSVFDPSDGKLKLSMEGAQITGGSSTPFEADLFWDGTNDGGQQIGQGQYFLKFTVTNQYGQVETTIEEVTVLTAQQYVKLKIYNSAGEVVRTIETPYIPGTVIGNLGVDDVVAVGKGYNSVQVEYAPGQIITWDGNNQSGTTVDSGIYVMKVEIATADGYKVMATKSVTVLNAGKAGVISGEKIYPNPVVISGGATGKATIQWTPSGPGRVTVYIYNMASELIRKMETDLLSSALDWDLTTTSGKPVSNGVYVIVLQAKRDTGETEIKIMKLIIIKKF